MKHSQIIFLTVALLIGGFISLQSQSELRISVGTNANTYPGELMDVDFSSKAGYQFGAELQFGGRIYFQTGLHFESTRSSVELEPTGTSLRDIEISRLRVTAYLGYRLFPYEKLFNVRLFAGPNASILVNRSLDQSLNLDDDDFNSILYGFNAGAGADFGFLFIDMGYMFGLNDVFENSNSNSSNNLFFANVGLRLKF
jgi:hypothetical protein